MIQLDLHIHPSPWRNGQEAFRSFAREALRNGINILGFSEHGPAIDPHPRYRGIEERELEVYVDQILKIKDEFKGEMQIFCGLELDYYPGCEEHYAEIRHAYTFDYFLVSVHIIDDWQLDTPHSLKQSIYKHKTEQELYRIYYGRITDAINSNIFDIIAHLDYIRRSLPHPPGKPPEFSNDIFLEVVEKIAAGNIAVEINSRGLEIEGMREIYPTSTLLNYLIRSGTRFTLGSDAHEESRIGSNLKKVRSQLRLRGQNSITYFKGHQPLEVEI